MAAIIASNSHRRTSKDLWETALQELKDKNELSFDIQRTDRRVVVEEVLAEVLKKEQLCLQKRWKWKNRKGEAIIVRDVFAKMVRWINKFKEIGDMVVQYDPAHAALPWAAIRFVLQIAINDDQIQGIIAEGLELILSLITRYGAVERMFLRGPSGLQKELNESIVKLYSAILVYLSEIHRHFTRNAAGRLVSSIVRTTDSTSKECIDKIRSAESEVRSYMQLRSHETAEATGQRVRAVDTSVQQLVPILGGVRGLENDIRNMDTRLSERLSRLDQVAPILDGVQELENKMRNMDIQVSEGLERLEAILADLDKPISRMASALSAMHDNLDMNQRQQVFEWLTDVRYISHHKEKAKSLLKGSCQWLLRKPEFLDWMQVSTSSILWLHGIPGSGKSMLVAAVIEYLRKRNEEVENPAPLGFFYCVRNTNEPERADPTVILRTILEQLSSEDQTLPIREPLRQAFSKAKAEARGRQLDKMTLDETVDVILALLRDNPATIILDGLDECDPRKRQGLLNALQKIIKKSENVVKIFVSSRDDHDLVHRLSETPNLYIRAADNRGDIKSFVHSRVTDAIEDERLLCGRVPENLYGRIISALLRKAQGMFRLVSLHIETLCDPQRIKTEENVLVALERLPEDLSRSYDVILDQIQNSEDPNPKIAERMLMWLLCAKTTLSSGALALAVCPVDAQNGVLTRSELLGICSNLVVYDGAFDAFRFAHLSVREHLEKLEAYDSQKNNSLAARRCFSYLGHNIGIVASLKKRQRVVQAKHGFLVYCIENWFKHVHQVSARRIEGSFRQDLREFLTSNILLKVGFKNHIKTRQSLRKPLPDLWYCKESAPNMLFLACFYGLPDVVEEIVSDIQSVAFNLQICNRRGLNCAQTAAIFGQSGIIPILFRAGCEAQLPDKYWYRVLGSSLTIKGVVGLRAPRMRLAVLKQLLECFRYDFMKDRYIRRVVIEVRDKLLFQTLVDKCTGARVLDSIMKNRRNLLLSWVQLDQRLDIDGKMVFSIVSKHNAFLTKCLLCRPETLSIDREAIENIISTWVKVECKQEPCYWSQPSRGVYQPYWSTQALRPGPQAGSTSIELLLKRPEKIILGRDLLRRIITLWDVRITQTLLRRKEDLAAVRGVIEELFSTRAEQIQDLLIETVIQDLDPKIEHTSLVLLLGDVHKLEALLRKTHVAITSQVIETVAKNSRHAKDIMKLLLTHNPDTLISEELLQTATLTGNLQIVNLLFSQEASPNVEDDSQAVVNAARRKEVLAFMMDLENFVG